MSDRSERNRLQRELEGLLARARGEGRPLEFNLDDLFDRLRTDSLARLTLLLGEMVHEGDVDLLFRVYSPTGGGLQDFATLAEIPHVIEDRFDNWREFEVTSDRVAPIYRFLPSPMPTLSRQRGCRG